VRTFAKTLAGLFALISLATAEERVPRRDVVDSAVAAGEEAYARLKETVPARNVNSRSRPV